MFWVHYPAALALQFITSSFGSRIQEVSYLDIANAYVVAKYSNGYLNFWNDITSSSDYSYLRALKNQEMRATFSSNPKALVFSKEKRELWQDLVVFCRRMNKKIGNGEDLGIKEVKHIGWCDKGVSIKKSDAMNNRDYWADLLIKASYSKEDFKFWDEFSNKPWERVAKLHDLIRDGGDSRRGLELVKEAKVKCDALRNKFKTRFVERDLESIPNCLSSLRSR